MKKILLSLALAASALTVNAQMHISTINGTNVSRYDGQVKDIVANRMMANGWNTLSLPFDMTVQQLNENFGSDCKLEQLVGVEKKGSVIYLNFQDVKEGGLKANTPYILYYTGTTENIRLAVSAATIVDGNSATSFMTSDGTVVTMNGVNKLKEGAGIYGIRIIDNNEAKFVDVTNIGSVFYATRCFIQVSSGTHDTLVTRHLSGDVTAINGIYADEHVNGKFVENNKVVIRKNGNKYNVGGARMK